MGIHNNEYSEDFATVIVSGKNFFQMLVNTSAWPCTFSIYFDRLEVMNGDKLYQDIKRHK